MKELLPFCAGLAVGGSFALVGPFRGRGVLLAVACLTLGALMSWVNGELGGGLWPVFVSLDAVLVWAGAGVAALAVSVRRRTA